MNEILTKFAETLELVSKSVQTVSMSAEVATTTMRQCIASANVLISKVQDMEMRLNEKKEELEKVKEALKISQKENERLSSLLTPASSTQEAIEARTMTQEEAIRNHETYTHFDEEA